LSHKRRARKRPRRRDMIGLEEEFLQCNSVGSDDDLSARGIEMKI